MADYWKRINIHDLHPIFAAMIQKLQANCLARKAEYYATSGLRTWDEQEKLYALGRTVKNVDATAAKPLGGIVTNAKGGQSYHNFGIAVDFALDKDSTREGLQPDWNADSYKILAEEAVKIGLEPGLYWKFKDAPHVQLNITHAGLTLLDLQKAYHNGGMKQVWSLLDTKRW